MNRQVRHTKQAYTDILDVYLYIVQRSPKGAGRVFDAIERTIRLLPETPGIGRLWNSTDPRLEGMRVVPVRRFPNYIIFFRAVPSGIEVFRVVQGMQELERIVEEIEIDFDERLP